MDNFLENILKIVALRKEKRKMFPNCLLVNVPITRTHCEHALLILWILTRTLLVSDSSNAPIMKYDVPRRNLAIREHCRARESKLCRDLVPVDRLGGPLVAWRCFCKGT